MRLWEVEKGACLHTLHKHQDPVYSIAFSPDGKLIASASVDMWLYVWSTQVSHTSPSTPHHPHLTMHTSPSTPHHAHLTVHTSPSTPHRPHLTVHTSPSTPHHPHLTIHTSPSTPHHPHLTIHTSPSTPHHACTHKTMHLPSTKSVSPQDGSLVRQYKGASGIFEVCWSKDGDKLAACYSNNTVRSL